jgi:hypothetical protein
MPEPLPSMDRLLADANKREGKAQLVVGVIVLAGGLAWRLGMAALTSLEVASYGAITVGVILILRGLWASTHPSR